MRVARGLGPTVGSLAWLALAATQLLSIGDFAPAQPEPAGGDPLPLK